MRHLFRFTLVVLALCSGDAAWAATAGAPYLDGAGLPLIWAAPFVGILLSIALFPLILPHFWHENFGKVAAFWALLFLLPFAAIHGLDIATYEVLHVALLDYIPFVILLFSLYTVSGGVRVKGSLRGTPLVNTAMLALGTALAGWMGTTGAAMLLIRPLIRANEWRRDCKHVIVFFIFLVANIGGSLTPLGDPPLFLGFLKGVDFFWTLEHMFVPMVMLAIPLLGIFYLFDLWLYRTEEAPAPVEGEVQEKFGIEGLHNLFFLLLVVGAVLVSGLWKPGISFTIYHIELPLQNLLRDVALVAIALGAYRLTKPESREANAFSWFPMVEVAKLFAGIFITIIPALAILRAGTTGELRDLVGLVTDPSGAPVTAMYFWMTGMLSAFLDNAPTYLVFFNLAGGNPATLMGPLEGTLLAISCGAVFMGALTYIGNAPNFMVRAIAEDRGIRMPSFFGYMLWSFVILLPLFLILTFMLF